MGRKKKHDYDDARFRHIKAYLDAGGIGSKIFKSGAERKAFYRWREEFYPETLLKNRKGKKQVKRVMHVADEDKVLEGTDDEIERYLRRSIMDGSGNPKILKLALDLLKCTSPRFQAQNANAVHSLDDYKAIWEEIIDDKEVRDEKDQE